MRTLKGILIYFPLAFLVACSYEKKVQEQVVSDESLEHMIEMNPADSVYHVIMSGYDTAEFKKHYNSRVMPPSIDLNQSLEGKSIAELLILKNSIRAMKGFVFQDAIFLSYFSRKPWYQPPYWDKKHKIELSEPETHFIARIDQHLSQIILRTAQASDSVPDPNYVANAFQWGPLSDEAKEKLGKNGFLVQNDTHRQLFDLYRNNQNENIPSFVTTDLIMHQMHMFYGMLENEIEELYLTDILKSMLEIINREIYSSYEKTLDPKIERAIEESLLYYSIPFAVITGKKNNLIGNYNQHYYHELGKVLNGEGRGSKIMGNDQLDYAIFKSHGHYAKNEKIRKYFKAMTWLRKINLCLNNENDFYKAVLIGYIINKNEELKNNYSEFVTLKTYFSSQKDQFTLWDLAEVMERVEGVKYLEDMYQKKVLDRIRNDLGVKASEECRLTVSLMPMEHQNLYTDLGQITSSTRAASPIDLFAALGNRPASTYFKLDHGNVTSEENKPYLQSIMDNLVNISSQENARSIDWISTLLTSFNKTIDGAKYYMQAVPWETKELNTALASWIQLDQRVHLTAEGKQEGHKSSTLFDESVLRGYVEPNLPFWEAALTVLDNTRSFFSDQGKLSRKSKRNLNELVDLVTFLDHISKKELSGIRLSKQEYHRIASIGSECEDFALRLINPTYSCKHQRITNDMAHAVNVLYNRRKNTNLIGGIGFGNTILTLVEIDDYLYMARGAVYSYYEIRDYPAQEIGKQKWKSVLAGNPPAPGPWMRDLMDFPSSEPQIMALN